MSNVVQRVEDFINGELQVIADDLKQELVDEQYEAMQDELMLLQMDYISNMVASYTLQDDIDLGCEFDNY